MTHLLHFSDAIIAFSIYLYDSIKFPTCNQQSDTLTQQEIISKILEPSPQFATYVIVFL